ncbi:unnamed protein product [Caenorhabditis bovis]|uniref:BAR domain-containing protein n=1 Tax=Caenorhabditis bovis TaxID=2654633 RepID=A0A8S1EAT6_9PELO|nr:unnamed protein product [Caenorhabditis bovis]
MSKERKNKWIKTRDGTDEELMSLADEALTYFEATAKLLDIFTKSVKDLALDEKKNAYCKAARGARAFADGMRNSERSAFGKAGDTFDKLANIGKDYNRNVHSSVISKIFSFKEVECKEIDNKMTLLRKNQAELENKRKKAAKDENMKSMAETLEEAMKKSIDDAKVALRKFIESAIATLNTIADEAVKINEKYCSESNAAFGKTIFVEN